MANAQRNRRTLLFDSGTFDLRVGEAAEVLRRLCAQGLPLRAGDAEIEICAAAHLRQSNAAAVAARAEFASALLWALLKAFAELAPPSPGMQAGRHGWPDELPSIVQQGLLYNLDGACPPRFLRNLKRGRPIDHRIAHAVLWCFRWLLDRPTLALDDIGAREPARLRAARSIADAIRRAQEGLPEVVMEGLLRRVEETAGYRWLFADHVVSYSNLRLEQSESGRPRIHLDRRTRYRPIKLVSFACQHRPALTYEWHEWNRFTQASLTVRLLDARQSAVREVKFALHKQIDEASNLLSFRIDPEQHPDAASVLQSPQSRGFPSHAEHEFEWDEQMVVDVADRDLVVHYCPVDQPEIHFDAAVNPDFELSVGDSPGLRKTAQGWKLERSLMPREVLAVRIRWAGLKQVDARTLAR